MNRSISGKCGDVFLLCLVLVFTAAVPPVAAQVIEVPNSTFRSSGARHGGESTPDQWELFSAGQPVRLWKGPQRPRFPDDPAPAGGDAVAIGGGAEICAPTFRHSK